MTITVDHLIKNIEEQFDDLPKGVLKPESIFRDVFQWNSINALIIIAMVKTEYGVAINAEDIRKSKTIKDIFTIIQNKMQ
jgi:acyl carrier protein